MCVCGVVHCILKDFAEYSEFDHFWVIFMILKVIFHFFFLLYVFLKKKITEISILGGYFYDFGVVLVIFGDFFAFFRLIFVHLLKK